jgi:hypothetical protein
MAVTLSHILLFQHLLMVADQAKDLVQTALQLMVV